MSFSNKNGLSWIWYAPSGHNSPTIKCQTLSDISLILIAFIANHAFNFSPVWNTCTSIFE